ncbi:MAG: hypothetical protein ACHQE6_03780 [Solirubrobacterales bacterium]
MARIRGELDERIAALRPLLSEYERLIAAAETLAAVAAEPVAASGPPAEDAPIAAEPPAPETTPWAPTAHEPTAQTPTTHEPMAHEPTAQESTAQAPATPAPPAEISLSARARPRGRPPRGSAAGAFGLAMSLRTTPPIHPITRTPASRSSEPPSPKPRATEAVEWLIPMPGSAATDERPTFAHGGTETSERETSTSLVEDTVRRREPVSPAAAQQAILAALEHGSHTPAELVMVTAMSPIEIRGNLGRLTRRGAIAKVKRNGDGKAAYALRCKPSRPG